MELLSRGTRGDRGTRMPQCWRQRGGGTGGQGGTLVFRRPPSPRTQNSPDVPRVRNDKEVPVCPLAIVRVWYGLDSKGREGGRSARRERYRLSITHLCVTQSQRCQRVSRVTVVGVSVSPSDSETHSGGPGRMCRPDTLRVGTRLEP